MSDQGPARYADPSIGNPEQARQPTPQQLTELGERARRHDVLIRQLQGRSGGGASFPPGGDPGEVLGWVGPGPNDVAWVTGGTGDKSHVHTQVGAATTWTITHALGKYPSVMVVDTGGNVLIADVTYVSLTQITVTFGFSTSGKAYLN